MKIERMICLRGSRREKKNLKISGQLDWLRQRRLHKLIKRRWLENIRLISQMPTNESLNSMT